MPNLKFLGYSSERQEEGFIFEGTEWDHGWHVLTCSTSAPNVITLYKVVIVEITCNF